MASDNQLRWVLRVSVVIFILGSIGFVGIDSNADIGITDGENSSLTVVSTHRFHQYESKLYGFRDGQTVYQNNLRWDQYMDIDPVEGSSSAVRVVAVDGYQCNNNQSGCYDISYVRLNLKTNTQTILWNQTMVEHRLASKKGYRYHDIDKINETHLLVAGIRYDRVFIVNRFTDNITFEWNAKNHFNHSSGGPYPQDWTHLNDVELLEDGRIMASIRNQDQVVFLRNGSVQESWTLGCEDCHDILYEQHNPDYIPERNGGPAILVADSENNRVIEYQRENESWKVVWSWSDPHVRWPRDADRLPNGNTLIVDSNGNRVVEVTPAGKVVWTGRVPTPYDIERFGSGSESEGGPAITSQGVKSSSKRFGKIRNGVLFVLPMGVSIRDSVILLFASLAGIAMMVWDIQQWLS